MRGGRRGGVGAHLLTGDREVGGGGVMSDEGTPQKI